MPSGNRAGSQKQSRLEREKEDFQTSFAEPDSGQPPVVSLIFGQVPSDGPSPGTGANACPGPDRSGDRAFLSSLKVFASVILEVFASVILVAAGVRDSLWLHRGVLQSCRASRTGLKRIR
jgi:hypothetical protein